MAVESLRTPAESGGLRMRVVSKAVIGNIEGAEFKSDGVISSLLSLSRHKRQLRLVGLHGRELRAWGGVLIFASAVVFLLGFQTSDAQEGLSGSAFWACTDNA